MIDLGEDNWNIILDFLPSTDIDSLSTAGLNIIKDKYVKRQQNLNYRLSKHFNSSIPFLQILKDSEALLGGDFIFQQQMGVRFDNDLPLQIFYSCNTSTEQIVSFMKTEGYLKAKSAPDNESFMHYVPNMHICQPTDENITITQDKQISGFLHVSLCSKVDVFYHSHRPNVVLLTSISSAAELANSMVLTSTDISYNGETFTTDHYSKFVKKKRLFLKRKWFQFGFHAFTIMKQYLLEGYSIEIPRIDILNQIQAYENYLNGIGLMLKQQNTTSVCLTDNFE